MACVKVCIKVYSFKQRHVPLLHPREYSKLFILCHIIFTTIPQGKFYNSHVIIEETEEQSNLPKITQMAISPPEIVCDEESRHLTILLCFLKYAIIIYEFKLWKPDYFVIELTDWINVAVFMNKIKTLK